MAWSFQSTGDRHMSNILVHQISGEVIHIDFGVVFEQGKVNTQQRYKVERLFVVSLLILFDINIYFRV
jgi:hypothetical protein